MSKILELREKRAKAALWVLLPPAFSESAWSAGSLSPLCGRTSIPLHLLPYLQMLDEVKEGIMNAYEIKTGMDRKKISHLMDAE